MATPLGTASTLGSRAPAPRRPSAGERPGRSGRRAARATSSRLGAHSNAFPRRRPLGRAEEVDLVGRAAAGDRDALTRLFEAHFPLAVRGALAFAGRGVPEEDLIGEASIGLIEACGRFDPAHGARFMTYAGWWVRRRVVQALARQARVVRVPRQRMTKPGAAPIAREVSLTEDEESSGRGVSETLPASTPSPETSARRREALARLDAALAHLPGRQRLVLRERFGIAGVDAGDEPRTLKEIAAELGLSKERVRQIEGEALEALRDSLGEA